MGNSFPKKAHFSTRVVPVIQDIFFSFFKSSVLEFDQSNRTPLLAYDDF